METQELYCEWKHAFLGLRLKLLIGLILMMQLLKLSSTNIVIDQLTGP